MAKTERRKGDFVFVELLDEQGIQRFINDCMDNGGINPPSLPLGRNSYTVQFDEDSCIEEWCYHDTHEDVVDVEPRDVTHEYTQQSQQSTEPVMSPQKTLERLQGVYDIREMSLTGLSHNSEIRQEFTTIIDILFDDGKDWWNISKQISGTTMIDTEKVLVIEMMYQVVHDTLIEYHNNDKTILDEILEEAEHKIKHISTHLPFSQESVLYDWWTEFKQRYTLPCEDNEEQAVLDMLSNVEGLTVELNKDGIILYDHDLETEVSVKTLSEAKDIIRAKQSYTKAFN